MTGTLSVRVTVLDAWDAIPLELPPSTTIAAVKRQALDAARVVAAPADFLVKFRGVELAEESRSLADVAFPTGGALIVLRRRRRAVQ
jgi:hypothetical protein